MIGVETYRIVDKALNASIAAKAQDLVIVVYVRAAAEGQ